MDFVENFKAFLVLIQTLIVTCLNQIRSQLSTFTSSTLSTSVNDPEALHAESLAPPSTTDASSQHLAPPTDATTSSAGLLQLQPVMSYQASASEDRHPDSDQQRSRPEQQASSRIDIEAPQPQRSLQKESYSHAAQQHLQWQNAVLAFCFSYALGVSLQFLGTDQTNHHQLPFSFVLISFLVLLTFIFILVAFFVHPNCTRASLALERFAFFLAAVAFCHTLSTPFSLELRCVFWAVFIVSLLIILIIIFLNHNTARS